MNPLHSYSLKNIIWLAALSVIATVLALSDVNRDCIANNNGTTSNDYLLGTWFQMYKFIHIGPFPTCACPNVTISRPTEEELGEYREKYRSIDLPHEIGDDALLVDTAYVKGLVLGGSEAKTYILKPHSGVRNGMEGYEVYVYKRINEKYMLFWQCSLRGHTKWLLTRDRNATEEEMQQIIRSRPEITTYNKTGMRFCNVTCY